MTIDGLPTSAAADYVGTDHNLVETLDSMNKPAGKEEQEEEGEENGLESREHSMRNQAVGCVEEWAGCGPSEPAV